MSLVNDLYGYTDRLGISREDIYEEKGEGFTLISFGEQVEKDIIYNVALVFYEDNDGVEVYIRKPVNEKDDISVLRKLNAMNAEYCGVSFFMENGAVSVKSFCRTNGNIDIALAQMVQNMEVAKKEFFKIQ